MTFLQIAFVIFLLLMLIGFTMAKNRKVAVLAMGICVLVFAQTVLLLVWDML